MYAKVAATIALVISGASFYLSYSQSKFSNTLKPMLVWSRHSCAYQEAGILKRSVDLSIRNSLPIPPSDLWLRCRWKVIL